jgi:hypothetical protein
MGSCNIKCTFKGKKMAEVAKKTFEIYVGDGHEYRPFHIFDPIPRPNNLGLGSQSPKGMCRGPSPIPKKTSSNHQIYQSFWLAKK